MEEKERIREINKELKEITRERVQLNNYARSLKREKNALKAKDFN